MIKHESEVSCRALITLIENQENALEESKNSLSEKVKTDKDYNSLSPEDQGSYYRAFYEIEEMTIEEMKRWQRYSICLSAISILESKLKYICGQIEAKFQFKIKLSDLSEADSLGAFWNYLIKVYEIDPVKIEPLYTPLVQYKAIRNKIAHHDGVVLGTSKQTINKIDGLVMKAYGNDFLITITNVSFLKIMISKIEKFLRELLKAIDQRYIELKKK